MTLKLNSVRDAVRKGVYLDKVLNFPVLTEVDKQFLELEKQHKLVLEQAEELKRKLIEDMYN